jgi:hypothetical protein
VFILQPPPLSADAKGGNKNLELSAFAAIDWYAAASGSPKTQFDAFFWQLLGADGFDCDASPPLLVLEPGLKH